MTGSKPPVVDPTADKSARQYPWLSFRTVQAIAALLGLGIVMATPALADDLHTDIVGGHGASQAYPGMAALDIHLPDGRVGFCGAQLVFHRWVAVIFRTEAEFRAHRKIDPTGP